MSEKEQQFERIYKETENFGRTQFVREIQMQINDNKKKDKVINDLLKRISDLEFEVERLDSNNQAMQEEMARTWKKLDKAIDYVNKCSILGVNEVDSYCMDYDVKDDLLEILKGVAKE